MQVLSSHRSALVPILAFVLAFSACGDSGTNTPIPATLSVQPQQATIEQIGGTRQFSAEVRDAAGVVIPGAPVQWTSDRLAVATVDGSGLVTAVGTGTATIRAAAGAAIGSATLTVATAAFSCLPGDGTAVSLAVGQSVIVTNPAAFCLTLPGASGQEYLVGIQSIAEDGNRLTPVLVQSSTAPTAAAAPAPGPAPRPGPGVSSGATASLDGLDDPAFRRRRAWRDAHTRRLEKDLAYIKSLPGLASRAPGPQATIVKSGMQVGDTVTLRVRRLDEQCGATHFDAVVVELVYKGAEAWWFEDRANPRRFTLAEVQALSDRFDASSAPVDREYLGAPFDLDGNDVIAVLFTKKLNERGSEEGVTTLGFVNPCDFFPRTELAASNEGEFFYHIAADPAGQFGDTLSVEDLIPQASFVIAHEYAHIIQFSRRLNADPTGSTLMDIFMAEGQATLAEEVVGHRVLGNRPGQNYGVSTILAEEDREWYLNAFIDLFAYYGVDFDKTAVIDAAPEKCTWTEAVSAPGDPCLGRELWYGVTWSLLRWASDQFGDRFPGGEAQLNRRLVDNSQSGLANLAEVTGESVSFLLGHWAPMLYMDDRIQGLDPLLRLTSWNLNSLYTGIRSPPDLAPLLRPHPRVRTTSNWQDEFEVRSPSFEWYTVTTDGQTAALRATTASRQVLPSHMQMFLVRIR